MNGGARLQVPGASPGASVPHKAFSLESLSPQMVGALGKGKRLGWLGLGNEARPSKGRVESREMKGTVFSKFRGRT